MDFKCLFCQESIKDRELVCSAHCEHFIHEYCIEQMKSIGDHMCKNCNEITIVHSVFIEFDKAKQCTIDGLSVLVEQMKELIKIVKSREDTIKELSQKYDDLTDRLEGLLIEHHAVKFEKNEIEKRLKKLESETKNEEKHS